MPGTMLPLLPLTRSRTTFMLRFAKTLTIAVAGAVAMSAFAIADPAPQADATQQPANVPAVTTGSINLDPTFEQRMTDCMAIWDKGTHMTKQQWRRTCQTTLREFGK
jgi:hypothetical protein